MLFVLLSIAGRDRVSLPVMGSSRGEEGPRSSVPSSRLRIRRAPEQVERALSAGALGNRLSGFEMGEELGRGGMGTVLRANDLLLGRSVAVKVLGSVSEERGLLRRFVVEAQLGAQLE